MFGYATDETTELMPAPILYSHAILRRLAEVRKSGAEPTLGPDAKSQLSVIYEHGVPVGVSSIVLSTQHLDASMTSADVRDVVEPYIRETLPDGWITGATSWHVNPTPQDLIWELAIVRISSAFAAAYRTARTSRSPALDIRPGLSCSPD